MSDAALPCPFCGHDGVSVCEGSTFRWRYAQCDECGAQAGEVRHDTMNKDRQFAEAESRDRAVDEWNKRA
jgi:Lar family restriction alleviation protein